MSFRAQNIMRWAVFGCWIQLHVDGTEEIDGKTIRNMLICGREKLFCFPFVLVSRE